MKSHQTTSHNTDNYFKAIKQHWNIICHAYLVYEDKKPVILLDSTEGMIYAYPYKDFKADMSEYSQASLTEQYNEALKNNSFVIFVRDNENKKLTSYSMIRPNMSGLVTPDLCELTLEIANTDICSTHSNGVGTARQQSAIRLPGGGRKLAEVKDPT